MALRRTPRSTGSIPAGSSTLTRAGRRVIALDNRGHGESTKLYDPAAYHSAVMADDVRALLDHLDIARADVMGYSMGARITAFWRSTIPSACAARRSAASASTWWTARRCRRAVADAMEAPSLADVQDPFGRTFRAFAEQTKSDLKALAACIRGSRQTLSRVEAAKIDVPVLIAVGSKDFVAGSADELAALIPGAPRARYSGPRPHARGRRPRLQAGAAGVFGRAAVATSWLLRAPI